MQLHFRPMQASDCTACANIYKNRGLLNGIPEDNLASAWQRLLQDGTGQSVVVIRGAAPDGPILAFGMSVFITDAFLRQIKTSPSPNEQLARDLHITPTAVKKRWERVYERVSAVAPALLSEEDGEKTGGVRGAEKKERLLTYLRRHPEELRPLLPSQRT